MVRLGITGDLSWVGKWRAFMISYLGTTTPYLQGVVIPRLSIFRVYVLFVGQHAQCPHIYIKLTQF